MTKYFDLLRAHQQKNGHGTDATDIIKEAAITPEVNPYSTKESDTSVELSTDVSVELVDEAEHDDAISQHTATPIDDLPTEDDAPSPTQTSAAVTPQYTNASDDKPLNVNLWLQHTSHVLQTIFQAAEQQQSTDLTVLNAPLNNLLEQLEENTKVLDALELEISRNIKHICPDDCEVSDLVEKSIMMMLYTIKVCLRLKLQHVDIVQYTIAAMLHHLGMAMVATTVRHKVGKLTKDELQLIRQAPEQAVTYLKSCHIEQENILLAAAQAGERYDGSGPQALSGHEIAWIARMVGLLSMFEALIHIRPYRPRLLPRDAIRELVNHHKKAFDPVLLKALIEAVSLYPVGTFVQLNTGEIGQVIIVHSKFPLRPVVYITMDKHGNRITEREINLKQQPNLMIQKCMYEESLENNNIPT